VLIIGSASRCVGTNRYRMVQEVGGVTMGQMWCTHSAHAESSSEAMNSSRNLKMKGALVLARVFGRHEKNISCRKLTFEVLFSSSTWTRRPLPLVWSKHRLPLNQRTSPVSLVAGSHRPPF
jgi:hypothetical protein